MVKSTCYISFVVAARNDNYGGDFLHRIQIFINNLLYQFNNNNLNAELIIVEWNPPKDKPSLKNALTWPPYLKKGWVKIIEVPNELHSRLPNSDTMPMFEYYAKNVGIRRAKGEYVLVTNPDLIYTDELIETLAQQILSSDKYYRADRYDYKGPISFNQKSSEIIKIAKRNIFRVNIRESKKLGLVIPINCVFNLFYQLTNRWPGTHNQLDNSEVIKGKRVLSLNDDNGIYGGICTNASGDFILTSRLNWMKINGFPEFLDTFTHLDSYGCHQLNAIKLEQMIFIPPCMVLHVDHSRLEQKSRPRLSSDKVLSDMQKIRNGELNPKINPDSWGMVNEELHEILV